MQISFSGSRDLEMRLRRKNVQLWFIWYINFLNRKVQDKNPYPAEKLLYIVYNVPKKTDNLTIIH